MTELNSSVLWRQVSNEISLRYKKILITGSSGWVGREFLDLFDLTSLSQKGIELTLAGSIQKTLEFDGFEIEQKALLDINMGFDLIIHCGFLTQDRIQKIGLENYQKINRDINKKIESIINRGNPDVIAISSGAVRQLEIGAPIPESYLQYAKLKEEMERQLLSISSAKVCILRIWNLSGENIQNPEKFALGQFIAQALREEDIRLSSDGTNLRTFASARDLVLSAFFHSLYFGSGILNSGGIQISIFDLALLVQKMLNINGQVLRGPAVQESWDYISEGFEISEILPANYALESMSDQILTTSNAKIFSHLRKR